MLYLINFSERKSHKEGVKIGLSSLVLKVGVLCFMDVPYDMDNIVSADYKCIRLEITKEKLSCLELNELDAFSEAEGK